MSWIAGFISYPFILEVLPTGHPCYVMNCWFYFVSVYTRGSSNWPPLLCHELLVLFRIRLYYLSIVIYVVNALRPAGYFVYRHVQHRKFHVLPTRAEYLCVLFERRKEHSFPMQGVLIGGFFFVTATLCALRSTNWILSCIFRLVFCLRRVSFMGQAEVRECLLSVGAESFVFQFAIQICKD